MNPYRPVSFSQVIIVFFDTELNGGQVPRGTLPFPTFYINPFVYIHAYPGVPLLSIIAMSLISQHKIL